MLKNRISFKLLILLGTGLSFACSNQGSIPWLHDFQGALALAGEQQRPVITYLFADSCTFCKQMEATTFRDPLLTREMGNDYLWVKLNAEKDAEGILLRERFAVEGYPTIVVLDPQGRELDRMEGYVEAQEFKSNVETFLNSPDSLGRIRAMAEEQPDSLEARYALGLAYLDRNIYPEARAQFQKIVEVNSPDDTEIIPSAYYYLSYVLAALNETEKALATLDDLQSRFPETPVLADALVLRGRIYLFAGRKVEARKVFQQYLEAYPEHGNRQRVSELLEGMNSTDRVSAMVASH